MTDGATTKERMEKVAEIVDRIADVARSAGDLRTRLEQLREAERKAAGSEHLLELIRRTNERIDAIARVTEAQDEALKSAATVMEAQQRVIEELREVATRLHERIDRMEVELSDGGMEWPDKDDDLLH